MWASLAKTTFFDVCPEFSFVSSAVTRLMMAALACSLAGASAGAQDGSPALPQIARAQMDSLASRVAEQVRQSKIDPAYPKILVIDFSNAGDRQFSRLGSILADDLAQSLSGLASGFQVQDRKSFNAYLKENWMGLDDFQSEVVCLTLARSMGGAGGVRGTIEPRGQSGASSQSANRRTRIDMVRGYAAPLDRGSRGTLETAGEFLCPLSRCHTRRAWYPSARSGWSVSASVRFLPQSGLHRPCSHS